MDQKYEKEYKNLCTLVDNDNIDELCKRAIKGELRSSKIRSLYWAVFLNILTKPSSSWEGKRTLRRENYNQLKLKFSLTPYSHKIENDDNPLSQEETSLWNQHHQNMELLTIIQQDVVRTLPSNEFFRKKEIQDLMINILFVFARVHPDLVYFQGFHEILAFVIFVAFSDQQSFFMVNDINKDSSLQCLLNSKYIDSFCYDIFTQIMDRIKCYYRISNIHPLPNGHFPNEPLSSDSKVKDSKPSGYEVIKQLETIKSKLLLKEDLHLHNHLLKYEISLSLFGIRWLRLLFGREFTLDDLLFVWDAIFAINDNFALVNYICVAMLIRIRHKLLYSDYTTTLMNLMNYPSDIDVSLIVRHALHMYDGKAYQRPDGIFVYTAHKRQSHNDDMKRNSKDSHSDSSMSKREKGVLKPHEVTAKVLFDKASELHKINKDSSILDGYVENDPEVYKLELQHKTNIMAFSRNKLLEYTATLKAHLPYNSNDKIYNAIDGIEQICDLLLESKQLPSSQPQTPVERAFEADESPVMYQQKSIALPLPHLMQRLPASNFTEKIMAKDIVRELKPLNKKNNSMCIRSLPKIDPTMERRDSV